MTVDEIALRELLEKGSDADRLREMIGFVAERLMALDIESLRGAGHGERTPARANQRDGLRERGLETRASGWGRSSTGRSKVSGRSCGSTDPCEGP